MRMCSGNLADMWTEETHVFRESEYLPGNFFRSKKFRNFFKILFSGKMRARARVQKKDLLNQPHCKHGE